MPLVNRRQVLQAAGASAASLALAPLAVAEEKKAAEGFTLPKLPYAFDALEPHIDAQTMEIHHDKHHQAYVTNLNAALKAYPEWLAKPIEVILKDIKNVPAMVRPPVTNNGGGHCNHTLFWTMMAPKGGGKPEGALAKEIDGAFKSFDKFVEEFTKQATTRFGSGWAWLSVNDKGKLVVASTPNQNSPLMDGQTPVLGLDVWEHAYYLKYQNKRADYIKAWWNVVNWPDVAERVAAAKKSG